MWMDEAARWHEAQAKQFLEISKDDPRIDADTRMRAAHAAQYHAGSAAALRNKASNERRWVHDSNQLKYAEATLRSRKFKEWPGVG